MPNEKDPLLAESWKDLNLLRIIYIQNFNKSAEDWNNDNFDALKIYNK